MVTVLSSFQALVSANSMYSCYNEDVEAFYCNLTNGLDNLERLLSSGFITLDWHLQAVELLKSTHSGLILLVEKLQLSASVRAEGWLAEYMDETVKLLDVCNALKAGVSGLEHYEALVQLVIRALGGAGRLGRVHAARGIHALDTCKDEVERLQGENKHLVESKIEADGKLFFNLNDKHVESKFVKWNGFWGVMFAVKNVNSLLCWLLLWGLVYAGNSFSVKIETVSFRSPWSASFLCLQQCVSDAMNKIPDPNNCPTTFVKEFDSLQAILTDVRTMLRPINRELMLIPEESSRMKQAIQQLKHSSANFKEGLETLDWRVNDLFDEIVEGRNKLLKIFSNSSS